MESKEEKQKKKLKFTSEQFNFIEIDNKVNQ